MPTGGTNRRNNAKYGSVNRRTVSRTALTKAFDPFKMLNASNHDRTTAAMAI